MFEPIAIIGQGCLLPGASNPEELWQNVINGKNSLTSATQHLWRVDPKSMVGDVGSDITWSDKTGCIQHFEKLFNPRGFHLDPEFILEQDELCQWLLYAGRNALENAGYALTESQSYRAGVIVGNLFYPTDKFSQYAEKTWLLKQGAAVIGHQNYQSLLDQKSIPENRFMSGYPAHFLAQALHLTGDAFALDAACASSLYAIKLACDLLHDGKADFMLAGGINATDNLFLNMGFTALNALSKTGQSLPLHRKANGLVPAQGAAIVVLKRLTDAVAAKDNILGVIRGIGLSNNGNSKGFLVPDEEGQIAAMQQAYEQSGLTPNDITWIECHATGTTIGDAAEIRSMSKFFPRQKSIAIGALKANIGHTITASGAAALINTLSSFKYKLKSPVYQAAENPAEILQDSAFQLLSAPEEWVVSRNQSRAAAINCFGFGGNNAHLLVEEYKPSRKYRGNISSKSRKKNVDIAIVGMGVVASGAGNCKEFTEALFLGKSLLSNYDKNHLGGFISDVELDVEQTRFPPSDLHCALGQQLAILKASQEALAEFEHINPNKTSVLIGMQCDTEIARTGFRWRLPSLLPNASAAWLKEMCDRIHPPLQAAHVIGMMGNIAANRINYLFNYKAPSFSVSSEEISGMVALQLGIRALQHHEIDTAVIGAVDMCCNETHEKAISQLKKGSEIPGDAAVVMVLKRLDDARSQQDKIYAIVPYADQTFDAGLEINSSNNYLKKIFGDSHAAVGLLHVASAVLSCHENLQLGDHMAGISPWFSRHKPRIAKVTCNALGHQSASIYIQEDPTVKKISSMAKPCPRIWHYSGKDKKAVLQAVQQHQVADAVMGPANLTIVAYNGAECQELRQAAIHTLMNDAPLPLENIYFTEESIKGEMAFVFTGAMTSYAGMGQNLLLNFPELGDALAEKIAATPDILKCFAKLHSEKSIAMFEELKTYSFLSQIHARFSRDILKLKPNACIGYCAGESNGLVAFEAWRDMDKLFFDLEASEIYSKILSGEYSILDTAWDKTSGSEKWVAWRLLTEVEKVKEIVNKEPYVRLTIINSPRDCVIAGSSDACQKILDRLGNPNAKRLNNSMVIHAPEFNKVADLWYQLHYRRTFPVKNVRFYSSASRQAYRPTAENAANAVLQQAANRVDFPALIESAWNDGVRIFLEHGPRNLCTQWIREILGDKEHLAIALDVSQKDSTLQAAQFTAQLLAAGIKLDSRVFG